MLDSLYQDSGIIPVTKPDHRVWWIGTGEDSKIPFHAAGDPSPTIEALEFCPRKTCSVTTDHGDKRTRHGTSRALRGDYAIYAQIGRSRGGDQ